VGGCSQWLVSGTELCLEVACVPSRLSSQLPGQSVCSSQELSFLFSIMTRAALHMEDVHQPSPRVKPFAD
jgi:hypothetical protein